MQSIKQWLKTGHYTEGVQLYAQHGTNSFLKKQLQNGESAYLANRLREVLEALVESEGFEPTLPEPKKAPVKEAPKPAYAERDKHAYLQLIKRRTNLYTELNIFKKDLETLPEGLELHDCARLVLTRHQQISDIWAQTDFYQEHGHLPTEPKKPERDPKQEMQYLRQSISKAKNRLAGASCRNRPQTEALLAGYQQKLQQLIDEREALNEP